MVIAARLRQSGGVAGAAGADALPTRTIQPKQPFALHPGVIGNAIIAQIGHHLVQRFRCIEGPHHQVVVADQLEQVLRQSTMQCAGAMQHHGQDIAKELGKLLKRAAGCRGGPRARCAA